MSHFSFWTLRLLPFVVAALFLAALFFRKFGWSAPSVLLGFAARIPTVPPLCSGLSLLGNLIFFMPFNGGQNPWNGIVVVALLTVTIGINWSSKSGNERAVRFLAPLVLVPIVIVLVCPVRDDATQYLTSVEGPLILMVALALKGLWDRCRQRSIAFARIVSYVVVACLGLGIFPGFIRAVRPQKTRWSEVVSTIEMLERGSDIVMINEPSMHIPFQYYYGGGMKIYGVPGQGHNGKVLPERIETLVSIQERVWLIYSSAVFTDPDRLIFRTLARQFGTPSQSLYFEGAEVYLFERQKETPAKRGS